jgi:hypothetical protein
MRCPKCGYLSYDHLEICRGCRKNISKFSQEFSGVVFHCEVPDFLRFEAEEEPEETDAEAAGEETEEAEASDSLGVVEEPEEIAADLQDDTVEFSTDFDPLDTAAPEEPEEESKEIEFSLPGMAEEEPAEDLSFDLPGEEESPVADAKESASLSPAAELGIDMSLDDLGGLELESGIGEALAAAPEPIAKAKPGRSEEQELSSLELDGFDLSGLVPAAKEKEEDFSIGELSLERSEMGGAEKKGGKFGKSQALADAAKNSLANLELEGIDFNPTASTVPAGNAARKNPVKSKAKTGTALDDFNFDLGELVAGPIEKPSKPAPSKPAAAAGKTAVKKK